MLHLKGLYQRLHACPCWTESARQAVAAAAVAKEAAAAAVAQTPAAYACMHVKPSYWDVDFPCVPVISIFRANLPFPLAPTAILTAANSAAVQKACLRYTGI